jgi:hypothetical protein
MATQATRQDDEVNEVTLVGRMSQPAEEQVLPSGSELWKFRVIVGRPPSPVSRSPSTPWTAWCGTSVQPGRSRSGRRATWSR